MRTVHRDGSSLPLTKAKREEMSRRDCRTIDSFGALSSEEIRLVPGPRGTGPTDPNGRMLSTLMGGNKRERERAGPSA
jgi:hypothetical protein